MIVLCNLALLGSGHLRTSIALVAAQGLALAAAVPLMAGGGLLETGALCLGVGGLKGVLYPWVLLRVQRRVRTEEEPQPIGGYTAAFLAGLLALLVAFVVSPRIAAPEAGSAALAMPAALATVITGLGLTVTRSTALAQVIGYVVLENGIFLFALTMVGGLPLLLELGGLLEVFFAVFVMGIAVDRISREFSTIDLDEFDRLRG